ncbi:anchored repeat-type ABC transporter ATP-binding subunit [Cellulomonas bogoriensis]|uniref:ABC transporter ATP-binding protein n=1 Tax=Cellulomonas bogoriensis 69B4 = DSM 16987 TaxID=1386082 RepID=A0A0A0BYR3_9CELL|nr:anchored repeat-type ABC transporter ATP-binding subunit [Cellulomonas bogoriensis]KGM13548.1 ABC transporter ATP-binding protein [Cellulomonas bogoriensis 69B4 = DSM 16987]
MTSTARSPRTPTAVAATEDEVLRVEDLTVRLGGRPVLHDVDLVVRRGELVGLAGPNGAGKTTLVRAVLGLVRHVHGQVHVPGAPATVGYVPQRHEFAWDYPVSVEQVVMSGLVRAVGFLRQPTVDHHRAVREALDRVAMSHLRRRTVGELSGGQRQRVLVARALARRPSLLLLDEPWTGLDAPTQELLTDLLHHLCAGGTAVLMSTHDLVDAVATCDRLCLLNRTVVASGRPGELRDPATWMRTFGVSERSPLLVALGLVERPAPRVPEVAS